MAADSWAGGSEGQRGGMAGSERGTPWGLGESGEERHPVRGRMTGRRAEESREWSQEVKQGRRHWLCPGDKDGARGRKGGTRAEGRLFQQLKVRVSHMGPAPGLGGGKARSGLARGMAACGGGPPEE